MLPENIDFSSEQHSAVSIGISYFKFKIIPGKLFGDGEENFSFSELGLIISGYVCVFTPFIPEVKCTVNVNNVLVMGLL